MAVLTVNHWYDKNSYIPEYIYVGYVDGHPWTFVYYDNDKLEKELEEQVIKKFGYSRESLYWDYTDVSAHLFSHEQELTEEEKENGDWDEPAYYYEYEIEDAWGYVDELKKGGIIK